MFKRMKIAQKLALICILLSLPIGVLAYVFYNAQGANADIANKEIIGVQYNAQVKKILFDSAQALAYSYAAASGDTGAQTNIASKQSDVDKDFEDLAPIDKRLDVVLNTTKKMEDLKAKWQEVKSRSNSLKPTEVFDLYEKFLADTATHIQHVSDTSTLILDPDLDSYYLMDTIILKASALVDSINQAKVLGSAIAARKTLTADEKLQMSLLLNAIKSTRDGLQVNNEKSVKYNKENANNAKDIVEAQISSTAHDVYGSIDKFLETLNGQLINAGEIKITPAEFTAVANKALDDTNRIYDSSSNTLTALLNKRAEKSYTIIKTAFAIGSFFLILSGILLFFVVRSITNPLKEAVVIAEKLAVGDLSASFDNDSTDETGQLLSAMNKMISYLKDMATAANSIAEGNLDIHSQPRSSRDLFGNAFKHMIENLREMAEVAESISQGELTVKVSPQSQNDAFGNAFKNMIDNLCTVAQVANSISQGDLSVHINVRSQNDAFGNAFRRMIENLRSLAEVANAISQGDLSVQVEARNSEDVFGKAFKRMVENLRAMAEVAESISQGDLTVRVEPQNHSDVFGSSFKRMLESLRTIVRELAESAQNLSTSANELVVVASQQTNNITEQASSIQQISTTLDEIRAIVEQASDRAKSVVQVSEQSLDISETGQQELEQVIDAMGKIKDQVEAIAENILDLSEKTIQIGEITSSVNDIAEQSNLLAVNAAIEATKAGEAGKGFGVVAVEVKNLAARSKKATTQVRGILAEIQKAANSTVMVTEEGSKRVESGVGQVYRIGTNIKSLHQVIVETSSAARQISSATNQQVTGIEQIALAMKQINKGTHDSVAGAKQQKVTAQNLSLLANNLHALVQRYRLN